MFQEIVTGLATKWAAVKATAGVFLHPAFAELEQAAAPILQVAEQELGALKDRVSALEAHGLADLKAELAALSPRVAALEASIKGEADAALGALEARINAVEAAAGVHPAAASASSSAQG